MINCDLNLEKHKESKFCVILKFKFIENYILAGDGVLDKEEYRQFWHIVGQYPLIDDIQAEEYFRVMTEVGKLQ